MSLKILPNKEFKKLVKLSRDKEFKKKIYKAQEPRKIDWPAYNLSQIKQIKESLNSIRESVNYAYCPKVRKNATSPKLLAKAILLTELLQSPERSAEGWVEILGPYVGVHKKIDDWVIGDGYSRPEVARILYEIFLATRDSDGGLSGDGTGLEKTRKQNYESQKKDYEGWYMTSIVDSREIIQAFDFSGEDECKAMFDLIEEVEGDSLRLDAGFNCRKLVRKIAELGMLPYVYPIKSNKVNGDESWREMYMEFFTDVILWLKEYYLRVHTESFHSAFKRVFEIITKVRPHSKFVQVIARIILHNRARLSYFKKKE